jgi:hypothetical protein
MHILSTLAVLSISTAFVPSHQHHRLPKIATACKQLTPISTAPITHPHSLFSTNPEVGYQPMTDQDDPLEKFGIDLTERAAEGKLDPGEISICHLQIYNIDPHVFLNNHASFSLLTCSYWS